MIKGSRLILSDQDHTVDYEALVVQRNAPRWIKMLAKHGYLPATA